MPEMNDYRVTLKYNNSSMRIDYHMGKALKVSDLTIESVINSLLSDYIDYSTTKKMNCIFTTDELESLRTLLQDY